MKLEPEDIKRLKEMARTRVPSASSILLVLEIVSIIKFPINSFSDLARQLEKKKIQRESGEEIEIGELKTLIPAYYFPITNEEDFIDKADELIKTTGGLEIPIEIEGEEVSAEYAPPKPPGLEKISAYAKNKAKKSDKKFYGLTKEEMEKAREGEV